jgi:hypothetical protein
MSCDIHFADILDCDLAKLARAIVQSGTDVMILKIFSPKNSAIKLAFLAQDKVKLCKNLIIRLVFEKNTKFLD